MCGLNTNFKVTPGRLLGCVAPPRSATAAFGGGRPAWRPPRSATCVGCAHSQLSSARPGLSSGYSRSIYSLSESSCSGNQRWPG
eukprot:14689825-Alexandrium_andersonii.AAC.1